MINPNRRKFSGQAHRFQDRVAVYIGTGETVYLTPRDARQLSRAINRIAKSCEPKVLHNQNAVRLSFNLTNLIGSADHALL